MIIDDTDSEPKKSPTLRSEDLETGALVGDHKFIARPSL